MKKRNSPLKWLKDDCDIDINSDYYIELRSGGNMSVHGCRGIEEYSAERIVLLLYPCRMLIKGRDLLCDSYVNGAVIVSGLIASVEFCEYANGEKKK